MSEPRARRLIETLSGRGAAPVLWWRDYTYSAADLATRTHDLGKRFAADGLHPGAVCAIRGEYSPTAVAALLAVLSVGGIAVPLTRGDRAGQEALLALGSVERVLEIDDTDAVTVSAPRPTTTNALLDRLRRSGRPGIVVFSSGSTGTPKAILHDADRVLEKFDEPRRPYRTLQFLLFDHFGGLNTLFGVLSNGGVVVVPEARTPTAVCRVIERARVELLPVTPTFLNLLLASRAFEHYDLSSVQLVTYGTEVMPEATLAQLRGAFPGARLQQTYGLSELGVLHSRSRDAGSVWVKVGGPGFETKIVDGTLRVRSRYAMLGYLNAPDPFDADGWMDTGDAVLEEGEWLRILGRTSDMINVGGQKAFPAEVEDVLMRADGVLDATARGEPHPLMGSVVVAQVTLAAPEDDDRLRARLRAHCRAQLASYKVPVRFEQTVAHAHTERFKKARGRK